MTTIERLRGEFMELPINERAILARELLSSLDDDNDFIDDELELDPDYARELAAVVMERSRQLDAGEVKGVDAFESLSQLRKELEARKTARSEFN